MMTMALGLLWRSRLAWLMALMLALTATVDTLLGKQTHGPLLLAYFVVLLIALLLAWRRFDRSSVAASTLFALTSVVMLLLYATFGAYYLGADFKPRIADLVTALYYAMVTMSTVGYGDITPQTAEARLFTVSIIVLGVAVFATSLTAVIAPLISQSLQRIVNRKSVTMKRENHFVVIGNTSLAVNTWRELSKRGLPVTRILREAPDAGEIKDIDYMVGDPSGTELLREAGAERAQAVQPDVVIAPQVLGGELTAMLLAGEQVTPEFVMERVFQQRGKEPHGDI
jgi:voltage-gated potassium channel